MNSRLKAFILQGLAKESGILDNSVKSDADDLLEQLLLGLSEDEDRLNAAIMFSGLLEEYDSAQGVGEDTQAFEAMEDAINAATRL